MILLYYRVVIFMSIKVRFFASLSDLVGESEIELEFAEGLTVLDVWEKTSPNDLLPSGSLFAINHNYVFIESP